LNLTHDELLSNVAFQLQPAALHLGASVTLTTLEDTCARLMKELPKVGAVQVDCCIIGYPVHTRGVGA